MSAIKRPKIEARERVRLETVIPLKVPFAVHLDICSACNISCNFCVHSDKEAVRKAGVNWGIMSFGTFKHIIDDMKESWGCIDKIKKLRLFQMGEPLLNKDICKMISYAKQEDIAELIEITTNATLLSPNLNRELVKSGLDIMNISLNGINEEQYREICGCNVDYNIFRENIKDFYANKKQCKVYIKYSDIGYSEKEKQKFYEDYEDRCDEIFVEVISATLWQDTDISKNVKNQNVGTYGQGLIEKKVCPFIFTTLVINDKGVTHLCCVDWKNEYILGDLKKDSIKDIWNGNKHVGFMITHLEGNKNDIDICRNCESLSANTVDNIDDFAIALREKILKLK